MRAFLLTFIGLSAIFVGCGSGSGGGDIPASATSAAEAMARATSQFGGEWSRVPAKDQEIILKHFGGDQDAASKAIMVASMAAKPAAPGQIPNQYLPR